MNTWVATKYVSSDIFNMMHNYPDNTLLTFSDIKWNALAPYLFISTPVVLSTRPQY